MLLVEVMAATGMVGIIASTMLSAAPAQAQLSLAWGVGGRIAPALPPPGGDADVINFAYICGPTVTITGPEGANWGEYVWGVGVPYDYWVQSYITNGYPYTHADEYILGLAIPPLNPSCPLPVLISIGSSLFKATAP